MQPTTEDALPRIRDAFRRTLSIEIVDPDQDVIEEGLLDSLGLIELLVAIEGEFGIELALEELDVDDFRTPRRIAGVVTAAARKPESEP
jgi:D-alanine--poly(phosphoribitol) ligase subunit 2